MKSYLLSDRKGVVLIFTFIIMVTLTVIVVFFLFMTSGRLRHSAFDKQASQALWITEAGMQAYIYNLANGTYDSDNYPTLTGSLSSGGTAIGDYSVTSTYNAGTSTFTITSTGTVDLVDREIVQAVTVTETEAVLARAIHSDGSLLDFEGSDGTINSDISCHVAVANEEDMTINGSIYESLAKLNPTVDFPTYEALADAAGQSYTTALTFDSAGSPYSGVYYTTRSVTIESNVTVNGSIFAEGALNFENSANGITITSDPSTNYPALATQSSISSSDIGSPAERTGLYDSTISGMVYALNNVTFDYMNKNTADATSFSGIILAGGNITIKNGTNFTINYNEDIFDPMPPGIDLGVTAETIVTSKDWDESI